MKKAILVVLSILLLGVSGYILFNLVKPKSPTTKEVPPMVEKIELENNTVVFKQDTNFAVDQPVVVGEYTITYDGPFKTYTVGITAKSIEEYRKVKLAAEKEFEDRGIKDICTLKILFVVPKDIRSHANQTDVFATGCKSFL